MLGSKKISCSLNTILLPTKQYIYSCKMNISLPNINVFKNIVKSHINIEKYPSIAVHLFSLKLHWRKRASLYNILNALICFFVP